MDRSLALLAIGLVFGAGIGFVLAAGAGVTLDGHDHPEPAGAAVAHAAAARGEPHGHEALHSVAAGMDAPSVELVLSPDPASGWNLQVRTGNFRFAPDRSGNAHVAGEGHAHLYVNGTKVARLYGPWFHLATLPPGTSVVEVVLATNDHQLLAIGNVPISSRIEVTGQ